MTIPAGYKTIPFNWVPKWIISPIIMTIPAIPDGGTILRICPSTSTATTGAGEAGVGMTHGFGMRAGAGEATAGDGVGTTLGDGTVGAGDGMQDGAGPATAGAGTTGAGEATVGVATVGAGTTDITIVM